ncbi:MAG: polysaccharide deacetylase family protein [Candidatus Aminicenantes bacterium]|nr:polysaccharide deacetylase family protein [Candidatus Aminicenantes bacterium]
MQKILPTKKTLASISLDLDNLWSYQKIHNDPGWEKYPSYFERFIPFVLDILKNLNLKITFFVTGLDASMDKHTDLLKSLVENGHEVGNHSFHHESWFELLSKEDIQNEIKNTDDLISNITGIKPVGFRGPGFSWCTDVFDVLSENGYLYDTSALPTYIGPLARMYYFSKSNLTEEEKKKRKHLYGPFSRGRLSVQPFYWKLESKEKLLEIPVTTIPFFKLPFHMSYLLYLSRVSEPLMSAYLQTAISLCKWNRFSPSFLLHPLDLMSGDQIPELSFFPGMDIPTEKKMNLFHSVLERFDSHFTLTQMRTLAENILMNGNNLKLRSYRNNQTHPKKRG